MESFLPDSLFAGAISFSDAGDYSSDCDYIQYADFSKQIDQHRGDVVRLFFVHELKFMH